MIQSKTQGWRHQTAATEKILREAAVAVFYGMGAGKSKVVVDAFRNSDCKRLLILCPQTVINEWPDQFAKHCADPCPAILPLGRSVGTTEKKAALVREFGDGVVVVNYESAKTGYKNAADVKGLAKALADWRPDMVVCDESHRIKAHNSIQSKFANYLGRNARRRVCLTGTPMSNGALDIFGQMRFLDSNVFGTSFVAFKGRFAILGGPKMQWVKGFKNLDELQEAIGPYALQVRSEDVLDLPPYTDVWRWGELTPKLRKAYELLREECIAFFEEEVVSVANPLVKALRLQQILSGRLPSDDGTDLIIDTPKRELLEEIVDGIEASEPVVVFGNFHADMDMARSVAEATDRPVFELSGRAQELGEWCDYVDSFKPDDCGKRKNAILAVNIKAGGAGINQMVRSRYCVFISTGYSFGDYAQARARLHRPNQERNVVYYHLGVRSTIDEAIAKAIEAKEDLANAVVSALRSGVHA